MKGKMMLPQLIKTNNRHGSYFHEKKKSNARNTMKMEKFLFLYYDGSYFSHGVGFPCNFIIQTTIEVKQIHLKLNQMNFQKVFISFCCCESTI